MVLTDTKITNLACFLNSLRYDVLCSLMITTEDVCAQGGSGLGRPGLTPGLESKFDALPRAYCGELRGCYQRKKDPDNWCIPPSLHPGALTVLGGCPDTLLGPRSYSVRVTQRQHWPSPEPEQSSGCWSAAGVWADWPPPPIPETLELTAHEDVVSGDTGQSDAGKMWLHIGNRSAPLQNDGNKGHKCLPIRALCPVV